MTWGQSKLISSGQHDGGDEAATVCWQNGAVLTLCLFIPNTSTTCSYASKEGLSGEMCLILIFSVAVNCRVL